MKTQSILELVSSLEAQEPTVLKARLIEYLNESAHQGWDGFSSRDLTGINRFAEDLTLFLNNYSV